MIKVRYERTVREPWFQAGVEGETKELPPDVAAELAAAGYVTLLQVLPHKPTPQEIDTAAARVSEKQSAALPTGESVNVGGDSTG